MVEEQSAYEESHEEFSNQKKTKLTSVQQKMEERRQANLKTLNSMQFSKGRLVDMSMNDSKLQDRIQTYINYFRNLTSKYLPAQVGQEVTVVSYNDGVLIDIKLAEGLANIDRFTTEVKSIKDAFNRLNRTVADFLQPEEVASFEDSLNNNKRPYNGTQIIMDRGILIIKGKEEDFWSAKQVLEDVNGILDFVEGTDKKKNKKTKPNTPRNE